MNNKSYPKKEVILGLIQTQVSADLAKNLAQAERLVEKAAKQGAQIICLPELFRTPYFPQYPKANKNTFCETIPGISTDAFKILAKKYGVVIIVPIYEKDKQGVYHNSAVVIDHTGRLLPTYRKTHIPHDPGFYEKNYFAESKNGYKVYKTKFATFAVLICYDQWFPEAARAARLAGADIIFYPTALGNIIDYEPEGDWHDAWETSIRSHGIDNSLYVCAINRTGRENRIQFFGQSFVADPFGKVLKRAGPSKEKILIAKLDLSRNEFLAEGWGFLRNRRPDTYKILTSDKLVSKSQALKNVPHYKDEQKALEGK